jgi:hypothetical protein
MDRLREMEVDDKVCEQVSMPMLRELYPTEVSERWVQQREPWSTQVRRVRLSTALTLVFCGMALALWSRRTQCQVGHSLVGKRSALHAAEPRSTRSDSGLSGRRKELGSQCWQARRRERGQVMAQPSSRRKSLFWAALGSWPARARCSTPPIPRPTRRPDAAQQQSRWTRCLSAGARCALGRGWSPCGGGAGQRRLRGRGACRGRTACWSRGAAMCASCWRQASPREGSSSTDEGEGLRCWGPGQRGYGNT